MVGVDSSTQSCKVVVRDAGTGEQAAHRLVWPGRGRLARCFGGWVETGEVHGGALWVMVGRANSRC